MSTNKLIPIAVIVVIIVGAGSFYGGMQFAKAGRAAGGQFGNFQGQRLSGTDASGMAAARKNAAQGGGFLSGDIVSMDDKSVTVQLKAGGSKTAYFSTSTEVGKFVIGTTADLVVGTQVMVTGKTNADGSVLAQSIQIRPAGTQPGGSPTGAPEAPVQK